MNNDDDRTRLEAALDDAIPGWDDMDSLILGEAVRRTIDGTRGSDGDLWGYNE